MTKHKYTKDALVVSSCYARQCHPETCGCGDKEGATMDMVQDHNGRWSYSVIEYGNYNDLVAVLEEMKENFRSKICV